MLSYNTISDPWFKSVNRILTGIDDMIYSEK